MQNPIIRFGIIGGAGRGGGFVGALQAHPATEITALCDIRKEQLKQNAQALGVKHVFTDKEGPYAKIADIADFGTRCVKMSSNINKCR